MNEEGTQQNCEKWALELEQIGEIWNAKVIKKNLSIEGKASDCMIHYTTCHWIVIEKKTGTKIKDSIEQFENTIKAALQKGFNIKYVLLILSGKREKLGKEKSRYRVSKTNQSFTGKALYSTVSTKSGPVYVLKKYIVCVIDIDEIDKFNKRERIDLYENQN
ncbi:MAG: hypothetical protein ACP5IC_02910 [Minisyncoccia bacterium]